MCDLFSLPIEPFVRLQLLKAGYETTEDLEEQTTEQIASCAGISIGVVDELLQLMAVKRRRSLPSCTALQLLHCADVDDHDPRQLSDRCITTLCSSLDEVLGGGIPVSRITEVCGTPGTGKTQLCLQLAINVQIPRSLGGLEGKVVYVDTEGSFFVERLMDMAVAAVEHFQELASFSSNSACLADVASFSVDGILRGIHYVRCDSIEQLQRVIDLLEDFVKNEPNIKLIIVDSIAFHLRETVTEQISYADRTAFLFRLSQNLVKLAVCNSLAVMLTNQMTTRIVADGDAYLVPALGDSWNHACSNRLLLSNEGDVQKVRVLKSPFLPDATARFQLSLLGIRDIPKDADGPKNRDVQPLPALEAVRHKENVVKNSANKRMQIKEAEPAAPLKRFCQ